ncbi:MAG: tetratricopeptide repeat protein [Bdellovibrionota bacterium]
MLQKMPLKAPVQVFNEGMSGHETIDILRKTPFLLDEYSPQIVITMTGLKNTGLSDPRIRELRVYRLYQRIRDYLTSADYHSFEPGSEKSFFNHVMETGDDSMDYVRFFGDRLRSAHRYDDAIRYHRQVIEKYPWHLSAHLALGQIYGDLKDLDQANLYFDQAIELGDRATSWIYIEKVLAYRKAGHRQEAELLMAELLKKFPHDALVNEFYFDLYREEGRTREAEKVVRDGLAQNPDAPRLHVLLAVILSEQGKKAAAQAEFQHAQELEGGSALDAKTKRIYQELSRLLQERGILHVAVQYPRHPVSKLQAWLGPETPHLMYVDNEGIFEKALEEKKYEELFDDYFGGNFGHMTKTANRLVAGSILGRLRPWLQENGFLD